MTVTLTVNNTQLPTPQLEKERQHIIIIIVVVVIVNASRFTCHVSRLLPHTSLLDYYITGNSTN